MLIATIGGLGRIRWAPGTWGSAAGLLVGLLVVRCVQQPLGLVVLAIAFVIGSLCATDAERRLGQHDPPAVVLDELWGMWAILAAVPGVIDSWPRLLAAFLLFRLFDILKPAPLKHLARLPGGWGIMADDLGAAAYTCVVLGFLQSIFG